MLDLENIVQQNEKEFEGKKYVYLKKDQDISKSLLVLMSTHNFRERYFLFKNFIENQKCDLLFVKDPSNTYYLENDNGASYQTLLKQFTDIYGAKNVTFFGASMSGYAAIYHGLDLGTNAIVNNPQIVFKESYEQSWPNLRLTLDKVRGWIDLDKKIKDKGEIESCFYMIFGEHRLDTVNRDRIKSVSVNTSRIMFEQVEDFAHGFYLDNTETVYKLQNILSELREVRITKPNHSR